MTIRARLLLLPLLLLLAQQGAWLHQLGHLAQGAQGAVTAQPVAASQDGDACPTCRSFGLVSFGASAATPHLAPPAASQRSESQTHFDLISLAALPPRSRGPPQS
jgi:hypothetical protein